MTAQPTLFDAPLHTRVRVSDPQTALDAARSITPGRTERLILDLFHRERCAMTDDEIAARLPQCHPPTVKTARSRLSATEDAHGNPIDPLLVDSGERRPSLRGRDQIAWRLA